MSENTTQPKVKRTRFTFHTDPGHAWLEVTPYELQQSGFKPSRFSYIWNGKHMLEEDCDAPGFLKAAGLLDDRGKPIPALSFEEKTHHTAPWRN